MTQKHKNSCPMYSAQNGQWSSSLLPYCTCEQVMYEAENDKPKKLKGETCACGDPSRNYDHHSPYCCCAVRHFSELKPEDWEKEFDAIWSKTIFIKQLKESDLSKVPVPKFESIKFFIRQLLVQQVKQIEEKVVPKEKEIEEMEVISGFSKEYYKVFYHEQALRIGFNNAIKTIRENFKNYEKNKRNTHEGRFLFIESKAI